MDDLTRRRDEALAFATWLEQLAASYAVKGDTDRAVVGRRVANEAGAQVNTLNDQIRARDAGADVPAVKEVER